MLDLYKKRVSSSGQNNSQAFKLQSDIIMNETFTNDVNYKHVLIQDINTGEWKYEDVKYSKHSTPSIVKDNVDYYVTFRPGTHYSIGTYLIIPNDTTFDVLHPYSIIDETLSFKHKYKITKNGSSTIVEKTHKYVPIETYLANRPNYWIIVGKDDTTQFVRYNILKCNWLFRWVTDNIWYECFAVLRNRNSYNAGIWTDEISTSVDNQLAAWIPDIPINRYVRNIDYGTRFMLSVNPLHPKIFQASKIEDLIPKGIIKLTFKQTFENDHKDDTNQNICDFWDSNGNYALSCTEAKSNDSASPDEIFKGKSIITPIGSLFIKTGGYFKTLTVKFYDSDDNEIILDNIKWEIIDSVNNDLFITEQNGATFKLKATLDNSLVGTEVTVAVSDKEGNYLSSITLEVKSL